MPHDRSFHSAAQRLLPYVIIGLGLACRWPALHTGFIVDDYAQLAMIDAEYPVQRAPLALFTFSDGSPRENSTLRSAGFFPWWSHPELRISLMRPLASALMWLDRLAFGRDAFAYHLHSACWWLAMMLMVHVVLRRLLSGWAVVLAMCLITIHPAHTVLLGWIANRNAIVATTFALGGLWAQLRAQRETWRHGYAVAIGGYALGLLASEYTIAYLAYGVCLAFFDAASHAVRARRLAAWVIGLGGYVSLRVALGFGTYGSGMYIDPFHEPYAFLEAASQRLPVLVGDLVFAIRSNWWSTGFPWAYPLASIGWVPPEWAFDLGAFRALQVCIGVLAMLVGSILLVKTYRSTSRHAARDLRFVAAAVPFALLPTLASFPESRLMLPALFGWAALLAQAIVNRFATWKQTRSFRAALGGWLALGTFVAECALPGWYGSAEIEGLPRLAHAVRGAILDPKLDAMFRRSPNVLLLSAIDPTTTIYIPLVRRWHGRSTPASCQLLMGGYGPLRLTRVSETAFELERLQGYFTALDVYASAFNRFGLRTGQQFTSGGLEAHVGRAVDGRPMSVRYELHESLNHGSLLLLMQTEHGLRHIAFPALGKDIVVGPANLPITR